MNSQTCLDVVKEVKGWKGTKAQAIEYDYASNHSLNDEQPTVNTRAVGAAVELNSSTELNLLLCQLK